MRKIFAILTMLLPLWGAGAAMAQIDHDGVIGFYPFQFGVAQWCHEEILSGKIYYGAAGYGTDGQPLPVYIAIPSVLSNDPPKWTAFRDHLENSRTVFLVTHGFAEFGGGQFFEFYLDGWARDLAVAQYLASGVPAAVMVLTDNPPGIAFKSTGIQTYIANHEQDGTQLAVVACQSCFTKDAWGSFSSPQAGKTFICYATEPLFSAMCGDAEEAIKTQACDYWDSQKVNGTALDAVGRAPSGNLTLFGNEKHCWSSTKDCDGWVAHFAHTAAFDGKFRWIVAGEQSRSLYLVRGYRNEASQAETLEVVHGRGSNGINAARSYEVGVDPAYRFGDIVEIDNSFRSTSSDRFPWGEKPSDWPDIPAGAEVVATVRTVSPSAGPFYKLEGPSGEMTDWTLPERGGTKLLSDVNCADLVVYTTTAHATYGNRFKAQALMTTGMDGIYFRAKAWTGSNNPVDARAVYQTVVDANAAFNAGNPTRPYPQYPILQLVGEGDTVGVHEVSWPDEDQDGRQPYFRSWSAVADLDGDHFAEGPVEVFPCTQYSEAQITCDAATDFNNGTDVDPNGTLAIMLGDRKNGTVATWLNTDFDPVRQVYSTSGYPCRGTLKESDFAEANFLGMRASGTSMINQGFRDLWVQGLGTSQSLFTQFLSDLSSNWTRRQRVLVFGPSCEFGASWWPYNYAYPRIRRLLVNDPTRTIVAGAVGQIVAGYGRFHQAALEILLNTYTCAPNGTPLSVIAHNAAKTMHAQYPLSDYPAGITAFGALVLKRGEFPADAPQEEAVSPSDLRLWSVPGHGSQKVYFRLPEAATVSLKVFNVAGQMVARLTEDNTAMAAGQYVFSWFPDASNSHSGVYFARLNRAGKEPREVSAKLLVVR